MLPDWEDEEARRDQREARRERVEAFRERMRERRLASHARLKLILQAQKQFYKSNAKSYLKLFLTICPLAMAAGILMALYNDKQGKHVPGYLIAASFCMALAILLIVWRCIKMAGQLSKIKKEMGIEEVPGTKWIQAGLVVATASIVSVLFLVDNNRGQYCAAIFGVWFACSFITISVAKKRAALAKPSATFRS